jgi:hypothetical protein
MRLNQIHLAQLIQSKDEAIMKEHLSGDKVKNWLKWVSKHTTKPFPDDKFPDGQLSRHKLNQICKADSGYEDWECVVAVMAWGGQDRRYGVKLLDGFGAIQPIISAMRRGNLGHIEAYDEFYKVWKRPVKIGVGAAYFTKLIFFCEPSHKGYIMDQWTSKSINLLTDQPIVHLTSSGHVSDKNTLENFNNFCNCIDSIAKKLGHIGEEIEIAIFSQGKPKKLAWRDYVIHQTDNQT